jgi:hypothetical protein
MYHEKLMIKKVVKRRLLAKVAFLVRDLDGYTRLFYRSQKGLTRRGYKDFKREKSKKRRSREKMALRAWISGDERRFERYSAEEKKSLWWWLW